MKAIDAVFSFAQKQFLFIELFMGLIVSTGVLLYIAPEVGLAMMICIPLLILMQRKLDQKLIVSRLSQNTAENSLTAGLIDYIGNIGTVMTLRLQKVSRFEIMRRLQLIAQPFFRAVYLNELKWFLFSMSLHIVTAFGLLIFIWGKQSEATAANTGLFVAVFQYLRQISASIRAFGERYQELLTFRVDYSSSQDIETAYAECGIAAEIVAPDWHAAKIDNITFRYEDQEHHTHRLDGVSLDLARGRKIALVGESGAGKSTLLRLLRGLHQPLSGSLIIDGVESGFAALAAGSTLVPQDAEIFENTLRYNITCGVAEDPARLQRAVEMAMLPPVLEGLPLGLDTDIRERGVNLSGGQKQRLALARGLYAAADSSLLLLDEPTSSLDPATEAEVFNRLLAGFPDACIVASLHRLHLLDRFDHIYVMAEGKVVEQGSFSELLAAEGALYRLWQAQSKE